MQEMQAQSPSREDLPEEEMATHPSILAWEILWAEKAQGYSPWGHKESELTQQLKQQTIKLITQYT